MNGLRIHVREKRFDGKAVLGGHLLALGKLLTTIARRCG